MSGMGHVLMAFQRMPPALQSMLMPAFFTTLA